MSWLRAFGVADKEVRYILRDPRSLGVTLALPVVLLILYGYAINFDVKQIPLAIYDPDRSPASRDLARAVTSSGYFRLTETLEAVDAVDEALKRRSSKVVLVLPLAFGADLEAGRDTSIQTIVNGADSLTAGIAVGYLEGMLQDWLRRRAEEDRPRVSDVVPIKLDTRVWYNEDLSSATFIIPGLVVVILMILAGLLTSQTIVREWEQGTMEGLVVSPVTPGELIAGKMAPYVIISLADVALAAVAGSVFFHVPLRGSAALLFGLTLMYLFAALGTGLLISVLTRSQQLAYIVALFATLLPSIALTGFIFPIASMPWVLQAVVQLHPATHFMVIVRAIALKGAGLSVVWPRALALTALAGLLLGTSIMKFKKTL